MSETLLIMDSLVSETLLILDRLTRTSKFSSEFPRKCFHGDETAILWSVCFLHFYLAKVEPKFVCENQPKEVMGGLMSIRQL